VSSDWTGTDFYDVLGVPSDAAPEDIRKRYRELARQFHPDMAATSDPASTDRFSTISKAYEVLSNPATRDEYDQWRDRPAMPWPPAAPGFPTMSFDDLLSGEYSDLLGGLLNGYGTYPQRTGTDVSSELGISFREALDGTVVVLRLMSDTTDGATYQVTARIPPGVRDGARLRPAGQGTPGGPGQPNGDLYLTVKVAPHPVFVRTGDDVAVTVPITIPEAVLGAEISVPTPQGSSITVKIPENTPNGKTFRVRGHGVQRSDGTQGSLLVTVTLSLPTAMEEQARDAVRLLADATQGYSPRQAVFDRMRHDPRG
jgi:molecular chaperone DnaJ